MKIFITGTRGIPDIPGGVEKHCQELFPRIAARGHDILLCTRNSYVTQKIDEWHGVKLIGCYAPRIKSFEAIVHTFIALLKARVFRPDVVHIHAAPMLLTPLARLMGFKVVVTNHGPEYDRQKWGRIAKFVLRLGEKMGGLYANEVIVISTVIGDIVRQRCKRESNLIYNGVPLPDKSTRSDFLDSFGIRPQQYILAVARFVPEKGLHDLVEAFRGVHGDCQLVIAGDADHETAYSRKLRNMAAQDERIILTGYITGEKLNQVFSHARIFCLPSFHEGLPIALLEAMSYGLPVIVSDITANKEVILPPERFFRCGEVAELRTKLDQFFDRGLSATEQHDYKQQLSEKYNWRKIADQTISVYEKILA